MQMKNTFELEGMIDSRESCFSFLSRSIPFFPVRTVEIAPASQKLVMVELSGNGHGKDLRHERANHKHDKFEVYLEQSGFKDQKQNTRKCYFWQNRYDGVVDLRSLGFYKIKQ